MRRRQIFGAACGGILLASLTWAADAVPLESEVAQRYGKLLCERAAQIEAPQVTIKGDPAKAIGVRIGRDAVVLVPQKDLAEAAKGAEYEGKAGGPVAYLFSTPTLKPLMNGKPVPAEKLRTVPLPGRDAEQLSTNCLLLAARHVSGDEWRLYAYGADPQPLMDVKFGPGKGDEKQTITVAIQDAEKSKGKLVLTVFGKYEAALDVSYLGE